jgi:hypothetical protein
MLCTCLHIVVLGLVSVECRTVGMGSWRTTDVDEGTFLGEICLAVVRDRSFAGFHTICEV